MNNHKSAIVGICQKGLVVVGVAGALHGIGQDLIRPDLDDNDHPSDFGGGRYIAMDSNSSTISLRITPPMIDLD